VNFGMAIAKGVGGYAFNSKALFADAIHSLTDLVSDVMTLMSVSWALRPPSEKFPTGYGKVESLGSLGVSGVLLVGGFYMGWAAVLQLAQQFIPGFAELADTLGLMASAHHGHDHSHMDLGPDLNAAWLAGGSILIKEWLYHASTYDRSAPVKCNTDTTTALKVAKERKSSVLASNAYHHRVDSLTAFVALLMIGGANVLKNASWMDPVGGLVISLMVIQAGLGNTKSAILELCDVGIDDDMKRKVRKAADGILGELAQSSQMQGINIRQVQGIKAGQTYLVDVEIGVPASWTVAQTQKIEEAVRERIGAKVRGVKRVKVRFVAKEDDKPVDFLAEFIPADVSPRSSPEPESEDEHGHGHGHGHSHKH